MTGSASLITGGGGFIGRHLAKLLLDRGERVRVLDLDRGPAPLDPAIEFIEGSILDAATVRKALAGMNRLYHLAGNPQLWARRKPDLFLGNLTGTETVLREAAAANLERIVFTSTEAIGRISNDPKAVERVARNGARPGRDPYLASKLLAERAALDAAAMGLPVVVVSPTLPIGAGDWRRTPPTRMLIGFLGGSTPAYLECRLNLAAVEDIALGHLLAAEKGRVGGRYILGGQDLWLSELLAILARVAGRPMPTLRIPYVLALTVGWVSELIADHITHRPPIVPLTGVRLARDRAPVSLGQAEDELGYRPMPIEDALERAVAWLIESGKVLPKRTVARNSRTKKPLGSSPG